MQRLIAWLVANPCASHAVIAALETVALTLAGQLVGLAHPACIAALVVSTFYYGREAGQREHDLKHATSPTTPLIAFLGAEYGFRWGVDNLKQWLAAAISATLVGAALVLLLSAPAKAFDGRVSWYGSEHGQARRNVACPGVGRFDPAGMTAAHWTLPCGSRVRVTDLATGRSVEVRITDRGPHPRLRRALDLARGAADALGIRRRGVIRARLTVLGPGVGRLRLAVR
ncbi:rlpA-like protein [Methylobacterium phyllosphaerae]|uniref:Endolytic peptidoglycan transglycosylase RlpA n=1 Tax=Methylobacterium phyllosphaerae TaxID=418223 RepID=A0AAE8HSH4_9HYPH|nr:septal ring lytic transglycosylase RlpA family protein [Methylobacterium phyllosphaerae]APT31936.1 rlpA-like protein [Methylobacterium phyllosphaerae]SFH01265.1 rare lipoprotein A [Methylobacterium phyllosphaerae]